ncbi:IS200/IS605 family transposase [Lutibacter sp.]|uniref:IS200/IS605 family transposase n=2 Tax=Lutibacter sp. TaxID=1925666 RepID=UPI0025C363A4|nr:IS200/IS605 family transposase [Lutibacter sp.]MCF6181594.1 IS200/IS605 family transposase [Lutibacter sp.]
MKGQRRMGHTVSRLTVHIVWVTKYRFQVLKGDVQVRCRDIVKQICDSEDIHILSGVISKDHVHLHIEYRPSQKISDIVKRLKGRTSRRLQEEFPALNKRYWGRHFWAIGYGVWSTGNITDKMVQEYLEHHRNPSNLDNDNIILE